MLKGIFESRVYRDQTFHYFGNEQFVAQPQNSVVIYQETQNPDLNWILRQLTENQNIVILMPATLSQILSSLNSNYAELFQHEKCLMIANDLKEYQTILALSKCPIRTMIDPKNLKYLTKRVILLTRDPTRVNHVNSYLLNSLSNLQVVDAIDAQTPGALDTYLEKHKLKVINPIKAGMVGCFCSHHMLWSQLMTTQPAQPVQLIMEDDVIPHDSFVKDLKNILKELPVTFDLVYFYVSPPDQQQHPDLKHQKHSNYQYIEPVTCKESLCAYLISQKGAQKLLDSVAQGVTHPPNDMVWSEIEKGNLEAYRSKKMIFTNVGIKETPKLCSNTQDSKVYTKVGTASNKIRRFFW